MTAVWVFLALSLGVCLGFILCSVMSVASEEQGERGLLGDPPLEPDSRP